MRTGDSIKELFGDDINNSFNRVDFVYNSVDGVWLTLDTTTIIVDIDGKDFTIVGKETNEETKYNIIKETLENGSKLKLFNLTDVLNALTKYTNHPTQQVELTLLRSTNGYQFKGGRGTDNTIENNFDFSVIIEDNIVYLNILKTTIPDDKYVGGHNIQIQPNELFPYLYKLYTYDKNYNNLKDTGLNIQEIINNTSNLLGSDDCESLLTTKITDDRLSYYIESHIEHKGDYLMYVVNPSIDMVHYSIITEDNEIILHDRKNTYNKLNDIQLLFDKHTKGAKLKHGLPLNVILSDVSMTNTVMDNLCVHTKSFDVLAYPKFVRYTQTNQIIATTIYTPTQMLTIQSTRLGDKLEDGYAICVNSTSNKMRNIINFEEVVTLKYDKCVEVIRRLLLEK